MISIAKHKYNEPYNIMSYENSTITIIIKVIDVFGTGTDTNKMLKVKVGWKNTRLKLKL